MVTKLGSEKSEDFGNYANGNLVSNKNRDNYPPNPPPPPPPPPPNPLISSSIYASSTDILSSNISEEEENERWEHETLFEADIFEADISEADISEADISEADISEAVEFEGDKPLIDVAPEFPSIVSTSDKISHKDSKKHSKLGWFSNLPVRGKQLIGLFTSEVISVVGLMGVASFLIISSGRSQLIQQAEAEVSVVDIQYNVKINQMGFGFRGQSDNPAIIRASLLVANGQLPTPVEQTQLKQILQNEITARQIEYATLVGRDLRIISNANMDRTRQVFDPIGLVSEVLETSQQIKASAIVPSEELQREGPPLPSGFRNQDALIRYTATPVFNPANGDVVGVLISGDIVNNKLPIAEGTLAAFENGYAAVYQRQDDGEFQLATSIDVGDVASTQGQVNVALPNTDLLEAAVLSPSGIASDRITIGQNTYAVAAKAIRNVNNQTVAVLVRGTSEASLNALINNSLRVQLVIAVIALGTDVVLAIALGRSIVGPLKHLQSRTQQFAAGDRNVRADLNTTDEIGQLADTFNELAETITQSERRLMGEAEQQSQGVERASFLADLAVQARPSMSRQELIALWVDGARTMLQTDRVIFYEFDAEWRGMVTAESVGEEWPASLDDAIYDPCFADKFVGKYRQGRVVAIPDVYQANLTACHIQQLEPYKVRANLVVPVLVANELEALLIAHQCDRPREWTEGEASSFKQLSLQLGYAITQSRLFQQKEEARLAAEALFEQQRQQQESLQMQLVELLSDVESVASGDLTVRADVTASDIGTVADFLNSIIENLRQIVIQVKASSNQVNTALGANADAIRTLADTTLQQAEDTTSTLASMDEMIRSINVVAQRAQDAANIAHTASMTAEVGEEAMDQTVRTILRLRATVGETAKKVKRLGEASQQISKVVSLINQITMQTNLLAINAGIEAARAGEESQGFAVIAEEVGELAARSAAATQEIELIVENIQLETSQVVEAMELGTSQVVQGTQSVEEAKRSLSQIMTVSRQIDELVAAISEATVSQVQTSEAVSHLMTEMAQVSAQTSQSSLQVSKSLQETVAIAQNLQESVNTFKVEDDAVVQV
ncbi:MAG: HAMP domain-containing protein [Cyanothece sp. SIO2G6]|nr:HAMP domain-containing protein [Cyanothece sp. SIO2G6]